jgi:hypothetical protein
MGPTCALDAVAQRGLHRVAFDLDFFPNIRLGYRFVVATLTDLKCSFSAEIQLKKPPDLI